MSAPDSKHLKAALAAADASASPLHDARLDAADVRTYEYGVRVDTECVAAIEEQMWAAHRLYNDIVAAMREIHADAQAWTLAQAGEAGRSLDAQLQAANEAFKAARAANDEDEMRAVAARRRELWRAIREALGGVRKEHAQEIRERFWSRIGTSKECVTYALRGRAVAQGLGWATANDVLERALKAWKASMKLGHAPRFAKAAEKTQDSLSLQFTAAGGVDVARMLDGTHAEFALLPPSASSGKYGSFRFRLGLAAAKSEATGTVKMHRPLPKAAVTGVRLVRRKVANKSKWVIQLVLRLKEPLQHAPGRTECTLVAVHFGWARAMDGRRIAGIASDADPGLARLLELPSTVEADLKAAAQVQSLRDQARDTNVADLKALAQLQLPAHGDEGLGERFEQEIGAIKGLRTQHVAAKRFYVIANLLRRIGIEVEWLTKWVAEDRKRWQAAVGIARRARGRRREFYRLEAQRLARHHTAIVIEPLDLKAAAQKVNEVTGERGEFGAKARAGRTVAALYEFEQEIRKAATAYGRALFELKGQPTVTTCAHCGSVDIGAVEGEHQVLNCRSCGAIADRKLSGAAVAWQLSMEGVEDRIAQYHIRRRREAEEAAAAAASRKQRMAEGRRKARAARGDDGSRPSEIA